MPGWWYTIESTTTRHLLKQFEHACREALSSDRATRELMRAKSAKQRFPVIEWIKKLDKLQSTCIKISGRQKKHKGAYRQSVQKVGPPKSSHGTLSPNPTPSLGAYSGGLSPPHRSRDGSHRGSYASSVASDDESANEGGRSPPYNSQHNFSSTSLKDMNDDTSSIDIPRRGIIEPPPKGSSLSRKLSLGTRLGPGHVRAQKHASLSTIESLGPIDEEQHYTMPDEDDEYMYSAAAIRRQMAKNVGTRRGAGYVDGNDTSDAESDYATTPDSGSVFEFDPQRASVYDMQHRGTDSMYFEDDPYNSNNYFERTPRDPQNVGLGIYSAHEDPEAEVRAPLAGKGPDYAGGLSPPMTPRFAGTQGSHLSIASVIGSRADAFALSKVEDNFTDADGKYFKLFSSELHKIDPKTSKEDLCIEEFLVKSEKEWSNDQRNKKLGLEHGHDSKMSQKTPGSHYSYDRPMTLSPPDSQADEPFFGYKRPTGIRLLMQRRIGDWPIYSFLLALVNAS
jgi:alpha-1,3-glucan synthase